MSVSVSESGETVQDYRPSRCQSLARQKHVASLRMLQMKMRTRLLILFVGLASLWCSAGPAKANWVIDTTYADGYPIQNAEGGSGDASQFLFFTPNGPVPYVGSNESSNLSGPSGTTAAPDYEIEMNVVYTWQGADSPPPQTLTFTASASASFSNNNTSSWGDAGAGASTSAASVQAGVKVYSNGSAADAPPSQPVPFPSASTYRFSLSANSYAYGYVYGGNSTGGDSSFTSRSSSKMSYRP